MKELVQLLAYAEYVLVPSTGVAHIAASLGTPVKGIYSPVTVHHPTRWAARGPDVEIIMIENLIN
jgi:ADP-heptose:LPS heptosyltransferase